MNKVIPMNSLNLRLKISGRYFQFTPRHHVDISFQIMLWSLIPSMDIVLLWVYTIYVEFTAFLGQPNSWLCSKILNWPKFMREGFGTLISWSIKVLSRKFYNIKIKRWISKMEVPPMKQLSKCANTWVCGYINNKQTLNVFLELCSQEHMLARSWVKRSSLLRKWSRWWTIISLNKHITIPALT